MDASNLGGRAVREWKGSGSKAPRRAGLRATGASALLFLAALLLPGACLAATDVEFVLDVSGSMRQKLGAESKIESARKSLLSALDEIPKGQMVAVRVYGHRVEQSKKEESCKDTELLEPFKEVNKAEISQKIAALDPKGYTPIAYSLNETRNDLYDVGIAREAERVIILLTDGEETCGGDPIEILKKLKAEGFKLTVYTVGFNVDEAARKQLQSIASYTGGKYFDAKDSEQLTSALKSAAKESAVVEKKKEKSYGNAVRGGDSYEEATPLELNVEYRLDHHQKKNDHDFFSFNAGKGNRIGVRLNTQGKGIHGVSSGKPVETNNPYATLEVHDQKRSSLLKVDIIGETFKTKEGSFRPAEGGKQYLLVGSQYEDMHKDYVTFMLTEEKLGDADSEKDAGPAAEEALPIEVKRYTTSYLGDSDTIDTYSFSAKKGDKVVFGIIPVGQNRGYFASRVLDEFKQVLSTGSSGVGAGWKSDELAIPDDGTFFWEITYHGDDTVKYSFLLKKTLSAPEEKGGEDPPAPVAPAPAS